MNIGKAAILKDSAVMLEWFDRVGSSADIQPTQKRSGFAPPRSRSGQPVGTGVNAGRCWVREGATLVGNVTFPKSVLIRADEVIR
jgi:hypothetical protein